MAGPAGDRPDYRGPMCCAARTATDLAEPPGPDRGRGEGAGPGGAAPPGHRPEDLVREFHLAFAVPIASDAPGVDRDRVHLRMDLVAEEFGELIGAVYGPGAQQVMRTAFLRARADDDGSRDTVAAADALGDLVYVLYGMALECGIPLPAVLAQIHAANMSKLGPDGRPLYREDGKVLKGPGYTAPDVAGVLRRAAAAPR